jgi:hypothetical protein
MAYFEDLSQYSYHGSYFYRPHTKNVGWLESGHDFPTLVPGVEILELLWQHCKISVAQMRGLHQCEFCDPPPRTVYAIRDGYRLLLGSSEIRVLSKTGEIYAAPTLIYHYVRTHRYRPPDEFLHALTEEPRPPSADYLDALKKLDLEWHRTSSGFSPGKGFKSERVDGQVKKVEVEIPVYFDQA